MLHRRRLFDENVGARIGNPMLAVLRVEVANDGAEIQTDVARIGERATLLNLLDDSLNVLGLERRHRLGAEGGVELVYDALHVALVRVAPRFGVVVDVVLGGFAESVTRPFALGRS